MSTHFIPEDLLRHLWSKHYLASSPLTTTRGQSVVVHACGTLNRETSGPDFRDAILEIGGTTYSGDVEFHRSIQDWQTHRHESDPHYNRVILHVVLNEPPEGALETLSESGRAIPVLILSGALSTPLEKLGDSLAREEYLSHAGAIGCFRRNERVDAALISAWLARLASERLQAKTERFFERLCEIPREEEALVHEPGEPYEHAEEMDEIPLPDTLPDDEALKSPAAWEQLLYEGVMDCLGYAKNREPFSALARELSILRLKKINAATELQTFDIQAMLFSFSGLLPDVAEVADQASKVVVHQLHSAWSALQRALWAGGADWLLALPAHHKAEWTFAPTRPSNFPTVRLASAAALASRILSEHFFRRLIAIVAGKYVPPETKRGQLRHAFDLGPDAFWSFHYSFGEAASRPHALLGEARTDDIIVNAVLPLALLYGRVVRREDICEHAINIARAMPPLEENGVLRKMERQLFQGRIRIDTAFQQQGAIELYREYCQRQRCRECDVGKEIEKAAHL